MDKGTNVLILYNIRSAHNVGSIFRTADAAGIDEIYITGYTPTPTDRFGRAQKDIAKTALGAEKNISWFQYKSVNSAISRLKKEKFNIIAIEQSGESVDYKTVKTKNNNAFIVGNEVGGVSSAILKKCDIVAEIPMSGDKESLNVSVATGIALFRILNK